MSIGSYDEAGEASKTYKASSWGLMISEEVGVIYMLTNSVAVDVELAYQIDVWEPGEDYMKGNKINFVVGIVAFLY